MNHKIITLSGSMKNWEDFIKVATKLSMNGHIVLMTFKDPREKNLSTEVKTMYDEVHLYKIDMSDEIYVINTEGYIGKSTTRDIRYAIEKGKEVTFHETPKISVIIDIIRPIDKDIISKAMIEKFRILMNRLIAEICIAWYRSTIGKYNYVEATQSAHQFQRQLDMLLMVIKCYFNDRMTYMPMDGLQDQIVKSAYKETIRREMKTCVDLKLDPPHECPWTTMELLYNTPSELLEELRRKSK